MHLTVFKSLWGTITPFEGRGWLARAHTNVTDSGRVSDLVTDRIH